MDQLAPVCKRSNVPSTASETRCSCRSRRGSAVVTRDLGLVLVVLIRAELG